MSSAIGNAPGMGGRIELESAIVKLAGVATGFLFFLATLNLAFSSGTSSSSWNRWLPDLAGLVLWLILSTRMAQAIAIFAWLSMSKKQVSSVADRLMMAAFNVPPCTLCDAKQARDVAH